MQLPMNRYTTNIYKAKCIHILYTMNVEYYNIEE